MIDITFEQIKPFLKMSKSEIANRGPYTVRPDVSNDWLEVSDCEGNIVAQVTGFELRQAIKNCVKQ